MPISAYFRRREKEPLKPVEWVGSALRDLRLFPEPVQDEIGYALYVVQRGLHPPHAKRLKGELRGIVELVEDFDGDAYRAVYTVKLRGAVYVLHAFQKKSTRGIAMPRQMVQLIKERAVRARKHHAVHYGGMGA
jgi:phage-related protein